ERVGDLAPERDRGLLAALRDHDAANLELEDEPVGAGRALVEVLRDGPSPPDGHLTVEVLVDPQECVVKIHTPIPRWSSRLAAEGCAPRRNPTTAFGAAFFRDGYDS